MKIPCKINIYNFLTYALVFAIVKPYFLSAGLRQASKICILLCVFLFTISRTKKNRLLNISCLFAGSVLISAIVAYLKGGYEDKDFLDAILYAVTFYDIYSFVGLSKQKGRFDEMMKCFYNIIALYCFMTVVSIILVGTANNSNQSAYIFGNKFTSSYLFIFLVALYGATHEMNLWKYKVRHIVLFVASIAVTLYIGCATATVTLVVLFAAVLIPFQKIRTLLLNEKFAIIVLIMSAVVVFAMGQILKIEFVNKIVSGYFNKSYTVAGRLEIYNVYLVNIIKNRFWLGYGYSNSMMKSLTGLYANAQNGLLEIMVNMGFLSVVALIITVFWSFKNALKTDKSFYISLIVYGMIIASIFEVALNWFFLLGVCLIRWNCDIDVQNSKIVERNNNT